jgi:hypothetical protein
MPGIAKLIIGLEVLFFLVCLALIIYLIFRRIKIRKKETFEDRKN